MPRRLVLLIVALLSLAASAAAAPSAHAAGWLPLEPATVPGAGTPLNPRVAVDYAGNVYAIWIVNGDVQASVRPVGGTFEPPQSLNPGTTASQPDIAVDDAGNAVAVWRAQPAVGGEQIRQARRAAGADTYGPATQVPSTGSVNRKPRLVANGAGELVLAWSGGPGGNHGVRVALATTTTAFPATPFTYDEGTQAETGPPEVAMNRAGDAVVVWQYATSTSTLLHGTYRERDTASFGAVAQTIPALATSNFAPDVAIDLSGRSVAVWGDNSGHIRGATRGPGSASWAAVNALDSGPGIGEPRVAFDAAYTAVATWVAGGALRHSTRPFGQVQFGQPPQPLTDTNELPIDISLEAGANGTVALTWASGGAESLTRAAVRPPGGGFGATTTLTPAGRGGQDTDVAVDPDGNAAAVWIDTSPPDANPRVVSAIYDATVPVISGFALPPAAQTGTPVPMSATAGDDWSQPVYSWDFGDGTTGTGPSPTHVFARPGQYGVKVTATDAAGNSSSVSGVIFVVDPPAVPPPQPPPPGSVPPPERGESFNVTPVKGTVLVSLPRGSGGAKRVERPAVRPAAALTPPRGYTPFVRLEEAENVPVGSLLDATKGTVSVTMARNASGSATQNGRLSQGAFRTSQSRRNALTTLTMVGGGNFRRDCRASKKLRGVGAAARRRPARRLFANVRGRFRTRGRHSTATVRGTQYLVKDSCAGTLTLVRSGSVVVRDLVKNRRRTLRRGQRYLARPRAARRRLG